MDILPSSPHLIIRLPNLIFLVNNKKGGKKEKRKWRKG